MELIQYNTQRLTNNCSSIFSVASQKCIEFQQPQQKIQLFQKLQNCDIFSNQIINNNYQNILVKFLIIYQKILKCDNRILRQLLYRFFLRQNILDKRFLCSINIENGQIRVNQIWNISTTTNQFRQKFPQFFEDLREEIYQDIVKLIKKILMFIHPIDNYEQKNQTIGFMNKELDDLKGYVQVSNFYSWQILSQESAKKQDIKILMYQSKKKEFLNMLQIQKPSNEKAHCIQLTNAISQNFNRKFPIHIMNKIEDQEINQQYLKQTLKIIQNSQQINQIKVDNQNLLKLLQEGEIKIKFKTDQDQEEREMKVRSVKYTKKQEFQAYSYQKQILKKLYKSNRQFEGLPKYYFIKGKAKQTENYCFTSLTNIKMIKKFLISNQSTISIFTKLNILLQINNAIRYLRNNFITFHNLTPNNVALKKGLKIKLFNFFNSYNLNVRSNTNSLHKPCASKYPYVSNFSMHSFRTSLEQKSDAFSMGVMIYQIFNNKSILNIKESYYYYKHICMQQMLAKYKNNLISLESIGNKYQLKFIKMLTCLTFKALTHHKTKKINQQDNDDDMDCNSRYKDQINISDRPYLDWITIILRKILNAIDLINLT